MHDQSQAIAAIATAPGRGAVGIVRVSGTGLAAFVRALLGKDLSPRMATYLPFPDAAGLAIDQGLAIWFPAPHSYTGEDVLELQAHGGPVVLQMLLDRCLTVGANLSPHLRLAEPGEFSQRAFLNDKIDLAQAEGISDLINAATEGAARSAARSLSGEFSAAVNQVLERLTHLRMVLEANLDFPEEEDVGGLEHWGVPAQLSQVQNAVATITESRAIRVDVSERRDSVRAANDTEGNLGTRYQLDATSLIDQPGVGDCLYLVQSIELGSVRNVIEQRDRREL